jgi:cell division protein FtsA
LNSPFLVIDIGSTKICAIIADRLDDGQIQIMGHGITKSQGIKKGAITNIELASKAIRKALNDAKRVSGAIPSKATVSISNNYAKSLNSTGIVNIPHKDISIHEINRVMQTALHNANIPNEYEVVHVLPYNFKVDDQEFVEDPFGMNASRLEVDTNIIIIQKSNLLNLKKAVKSAGVEIKNVVLNGYASALSTICSDDVELGVGVIDLGGQTSSLVIFTGNSVRHNDFFAVGSNHITNDLSIALHTPLQIAENIKIRHGNLAERSDEIVELPIIGNEESRNEVSLGIVHSVIFARVEETLMILAKMVEKSALKEQMGAGIILTGGMANLKGIRELAGAIFSDMPVRVSTPDIKNIKGVFEELKNPAFAAAIGLLQYAIGNHTEYEIDINKELLHSKDKEEIDESLKDLNIGETIEEIHKNKKMAKTKAKNEANESEDGSYGFDQGFELPKLPKEKGNFVGKFVNWAKQLF